MFYELMDHITLIPEKLHDLLVLQAYEFCDCYLSFPVSSRWTFRSQDMTPRFSVMPTLKSKGENVVPPIYSIVSNFLELSTSRSLGSRVMGKANPLRSFDLNRML